MKKDVTFPFEGSPNEFSVFIYDIAAGFPLEFKPFIIPNLGKSVGDQYETEQQNARCYKE